MTLGTGADSSLREPMSRPGRGAKKRVLFVEASSGGIIGGSLTGLLHQIGGMDQTWSIALALYEPKGIEEELRRAGIRVYRVLRWRIPKKHPLQQRASYRAARKIAPLRAGLSWTRLVARTLAEELPAALALARVIRAEQPSVVHLGNGVRANFDGILACWLTRTPCVCHVKGFEKYGARERWAARRIDALVCMTEALRRHCERSGVIAPRVEVIYDAVDLEHFRPRRPRAEVRRELGLGPEHCALGIVGGIQEWKGQAVVVEAFAQLWPRLPDLRCLIVGGVHRAGKEYSARLERRVAELGLSSAVAFLGFRRDVPDIVNALDIVVHASIRPEPFGRVILEGMLLGRPVIAAAGGGVLELVEDGSTGYLYPPGDAAALAEQIFALATDPELRARVGRAAQLWATRRFSLQAHVEAMAELYSSVIGGKNR